jgi:alanine racemase
MVASLDRCRKAYPDAGESPSADDALRAVLAVVYKPARTIMRPAIATIDLRALRHNLGVARRRAPKSRIVAVVKANAYGHGAARILPALAEAEMLGVACLEEAIALREAGAGQPIVLLEGVYAADELFECFRLGLEVVVHEPGQLRMLELARLPRPLTAWLKVDSGMGRLGFRPEAAASAWRRLRACPAVEKVRLMSHLARADEPGDPATPEQIRRFVALDLPGERSCANSAGLLGWPAAHGDWVRPGIMLYGVSPMPGRSGLDDGLLPVMTLETRLIAVKEVRAGEAIGYGGTWRAPSDRRIGIAAIGYADGYPRHAPSGTPVLVEGRPAPLAGRVSMDMIAVDLAGHPAAAVGARVVLWGEGLPIEQLAARAGTIGYELLCGLAGRVHVRLRDDGAGG